MCKRILKKLYKLLTKQWNYLKIIKTNKKKKRFKSEANNVYTEEIKNIVCSSNDDKRLQTFDKIISYPYGAGVGKVYKTDLLEYLNIKRLILMMLQMKIKHNILQNGQIFLIIHTEY